MYPKSNSFKMVGLAGVLLGSIMLTGCATKVGKSVGDLLNPFDETPDTELGDRSSKALMETSGGSQAQQARHALEVMGTYRSAQAPEPYYPVVQPAEVRLMWVPDHLNRAGDLVPAHYYYLKVLSDRWAVQDAFELERQLNEKSVEGSATPWVYGDTKRK